MSRPDPLAVAFRRGLSQDCGLERHVHKLLNDRINKCMYLITHFLISINFLSVWFVFLKAAKKFVSGQKSMAASGNLGHTPFVDEL